MKKYSKGQAEAISGIIVGAVLLFVGLFMVATVSNITPESTLKDYGYTTATNSTDLTIDVTSNGTHKVTIGTIVSITGETASSLLTTIVDNQNGTNSFTVYVLLNDVSLGTITATNNTITTQQFSDVNWVTGSVNTLTYVSNNVGSEVFVNSSASYYPSSKVDTGFGDINTSTISTMGTVFSVLGLVLIVIALALAISALKGSMIGGGRPVA